MFIEPDKVIEKISDLRKEGIKKVVAKGGIFDKFLDYLRKVSADPSNVLDNEDDIRKYYFYTLWHKKLYEAFQLEQKWQVKPRPKKHDLIMLIFEYNAHDKLANWVVNHNLTSKEAYETRYNLLKKTQPKIRTNVKNKSISLDKNTIKRIQYDFVMNRVQQLLNLQYNTNSQSSSNKEKRVPKASSKIAENMQNKLRTQSVNASSEIFKLLKKEYKTNSQALTIEAIQNRYNEEIEKLQQQIKKLQQQSYQETIDSTVSMEQEEVTMEPQSKKKKADSTDQL
jgi:hypothetical protein